MNLKRVTLFSKTVNFKVTLALLIKYIVGVFFHAKLTHLWCWSRN